MRQIRDHGDAGYDGRLRAYVVRLIERVVVHDENITVIARPKDAGSADTLVNELLDDPPTSDASPTSDDPPTS